MPVNESRQSIRETCLGELSGNILSYLPFGQAFESDLGTQLMHHQILLGRLRGQRFNHPLGSKGAGQMPERLQERVVSFLPAETLDTLSARDGKVLAATERLLKCVQQRALPDACFAGHEYNLTLPLKRLA